MTPEEILRKIEQFCKNTGGRFEREKILDTEIVACMYDEPVRIILSSSLRADLVKKLTLDVYLTPEEPYYRSENEVEESINIPADVELKIKGKGVADIFFDNKNLGRPLFPSSGSIICGRAKGILIHKTKNSIVFEIR